MVVLNSCPASDAPCFPSRSFRDAAGKSARHRFVLQVLGCFSLFSTFFFFRISVVLAERQRTSGLRVQVRPSACRTLQSIRCSSASFDRFHALKTLKDRFGSIIVRFFPADTGLVECSLLFGSTVTSTSAPALLD